jgi:hypothetical protein
MVTCLTFTCDSSPLLVRTLTTEVILDSTTLRRLSLTSSASRLIKDEGSRTFVTLVKVLFSHITLRLVRFGLYALRRPGVKYYTL